WMGLGPVHIVPLAAARERARAARLQLLDGVDPLEARLAARDAAFKEERERLSFKEAADKFLAVHSDTWRNDTWRNAKHRKQWTSTLADYAYPKLGMRPVASIDTALVNDTLAAL